MNAIKGTRCRALQNIIGHQGFIKVDSYGTIEGETENLGRHLIQVQWDQSITMYVFPHEIEIIEDGDRCAA